MQTESRRIRHADAFDLRMIKPLVTNARLEVVQLSGLAEKQGI